ncbi:MAG: beta-xylosidase [Acidobacteria bacterium]|nr:MAG: beta-xylosidase [Acidobacteriota bacterium]PYY02526.1 MAG: beta-xylosidase [Acidobacteriota bacterium]PYY23031.1 MAG: beta-xylosidase [Acidobacteriota bacterium]
MVEAVMLWNEPNNLSHWDFKIDPDWKKFAEMAIAAGKAIRSVNPELPIVLGGISPIDPNFIQLMGSHGILNAVDVVAIHGFPLDWNHWNVNEWPAKVDEIRAVTKLPVWISEVGASSFGAEEVQLFGLQRMSELLLGNVERIHWYSLFDLPASWTATTRHKEAEGSAYYRHYYMGLLREDETPKMAAAEFPEGLGICQWFHYEDHRLDSAVEWLHRLKVRYLRTGVSWADSHRENAELWFDRQMKALEPFNTTLTLCFTPEHLGIAPHYTSPPKDPNTFAEFAQWAVSRYAPAPVRTNSAYAMPEEMAAPSVLR